MMWDTNSDEIAGILLKWIEKHVERRRQSYCVRSVS